MSIHRRRDIKHSHNDSELIPNSLNLNNSPQILQLPKKHKIQLLASRTFQTQLSFQPPTSCMAAPLPAPPRLD